MGFRLAAFKQRLIFRGVFLLLILATLSIALVLLTEEKERSYSNYQQVVQKTSAEIMARLRHPTGRLMLLNPQHNRQNKAPLSPLIIPYSAIDFTDRNKALQMVEMTGCAAQYQNGSSLCAAMGYNPYAGAFIYLVGNYKAHDLIGRKLKQRDFENVDHLIITINLPHEKTRWVVPFEDHSKEGAKSKWGRLPGFKTNEDRFTAFSKADRDFRGWIWQNERCINSIQSDEDYAKDTFFAIRIPVERFKINSIGVRPLQWPPIPLNDVKVVLQAFQAGQNTPLFDSNNANVTLPPTLEDISQILTPGETLKIHKLGTSPETIMTLKSSQSLTKISVWYQWIIKHLPTRSNLSTLIRTDIVSTPLGQYEIQLEGNTQTVDQLLAITSYRMAWYVGGMVLAILLAWIAIELGVIRPIVRLTKQAARLANNMQQSDLKASLAQLDFTNLKGKDELGTLAAALDNLLQRVKDDLQRETIRVQQERDMWHAVGHEIMSPLQSLMVLHRDKDEASYRYVKRMQQAIQVIYGTASPSEAFAEATLQVGLLNLNDFLITIADNARFVDIHHVQFIPCKESVMVRADEFSLEDTVTHILRNADRYRHRDTSIQIHIELTNTTAQIFIYNQGEPIKPELINNIFEYGVSESTQDEDTSHRGQGLFVAKTYMAKMGGSIDVRNETEGVTFILTLQRQ